MKKAILALAATLVTIASIAPAVADEYHHHPVCHKVHVHNHWEKRCH
jgi:hypothetical protein